jgi:hypothetical protein
MKYAYVIAALALAGCMGVYNKEVYLADGSKGFAINCDGDYADWNTCLNEAGKICGPYGYKEIERHDEKGYRKQGVAYSGYRDSYSSSTRGRSMVIACNPGRFVPVPATTAVKK